MAKLTFTHTSRFDISTPPIQTTSLFYDTDGVLKQRDATGLVSVIGTTGYTPNTYFSGLTDVHLLNPQDNDLLYWSGGSVVNDHRILSGGTDISNLFLLSVNYSNIWIPGSGSNSATMSGNGCTASGTYSLAEGYLTQANANISHAEGYLTKANGQTSHAEGEQSIAQGAYSHAEGYITLASDYSHSEGNRTQANGLYSHAEGYLTRANGNFSHAEGNNTIAGGDYSFSTGKNNKINGEGSAAIAAHDFTGSTTYTLYTDKIEIINSATTNQVILTDVTNGKKYGLCMSGGTLIATLI